MPARGAAIECPKSMTRISRSTPVRSVAVGEACAAVIRPFVGKAQWRWGTCPQYSDAPGGEQGIALRTSHVVLTLLCRTSSAITPPQMLAATEATHSVLAVRRRPVERSRRCPSNKSPQNCPVLSPSSKRCSGWAAGLALTPRPWACHGGPRKVRCGGKRAAIYCLVILARSEERRVG